MMKGRLSAPGFTIGMPVGLVSVLVVVYGVGTVGLLASGTLGLPDAMLMLALPTALALALLRPEWTVLLVLLLPPASFVPVRALNLLLAVTIFGFLLQGRVRLGPRTGVLPLVGIITLAIVLKSSTSADAEAAANTMLNFLIYYTLLTLVAFHAVANGKLNIDTFTNIFLLGLLLAAVIQPFFLASAGFQQIIDTPFRGQFAYLSVM
jgi:hypothetical protein